MGNVETYVYKLRGIMQAGLKGLDLFLFGLSHKDSTTCEYYHDCFLDLGTDGPSPDCCPP
jgi:hypothetical protein